MSQWCDTCRGSGYGGDSGHVYNTQEEYDGTREHVCRQCPVPCPSCGGSGLDPDRLERATEAMVVADSSDLPSAGNPWWELRDVDRNEARRITAAAITAYLRGEDDE